MSLVQIPGLGLFKGSAGSSMDVAVGAGAGLAGIAAVKFAVNKFAPGKLPALVLRALPFLSGAATAGVLYATGKRGGHGKGRAIGALMAGVAINAWDEIRANVPELADLVSLNLNGMRGLRSYRGMIVDNPNRGAMNGMIVNNPNGRLNALHAISMRPDDEY